MDALTAIGIALLWSFGGALGFIPLEPPADEASTEQQDGPTEAAIVAVVVGPVVALVALLLGMAQY